MTNSEYNFNNYPLAKVKGVTTTNIVKFQKLKINSLAQLVMYLPRNYEDRASIYLLNEVNSGNKCNVMITVTQKYFKEQGRRSQLVVAGVDANEDPVKITFFNQAGYFSNLLEVGTAYIFYGIIQVNTYAGQGYVIMHPEVHSLEQQAQQEPADKTLSAIYPTTKGLTQATFRKVMNNGLDLVAQLGFEEYQLPQGYPPIPLNLDRDGKPCNFIDINDVPLFEAIKKLHHPPLDVSIQQIRDGKSPWLVKIISEELLAKCLSLIKAKSLTKKQLTIQFSAELGFAKFVRDHLQFKLTNAQAKALDDVIKDLASGRPMLRLIQGDVGCGKTMIAVLAIAHVIDAGYQACLMAPTDILATQLYQSVVEVLGAYGVKVVLVNGKLKAREKREIAAQIASGEAHVVVGTHALYSDWVQFHNLALAIVDEQHRFGVEQRLNLSKKQPNFRIHFMMMSATPAPRSIAMTLHADLDLTIIDELPPGRTPVFTFMLSDVKRASLIQRIRHKIMYDHSQVYWVCSLVEESEILEVQSATEAFILLSQEIPEARIGLVHGRMKDEEKNAVMQAFKNQELDMLVATTVIEVGVNVPNASIMIIENPERLGLSQIHQLRGRVGRGSKESFCCLLHGDNISRTTKQRLAIFPQTNDGFVIAEKDMQIRGTGDIVGTAQSGSMEFLVADLVRDSAIAQTIYPLANELYQQDPELADKIIQRWVQDKQYFTQA